jgi:crotonobetainyl-CoA:carnitine CoA-transferase CaiB-like acyl-CoA transferase
MTMQGPLDDIRVVELADTPMVAAAGAVLADLGADVVLVEPPGGHPGRAERGSAPPGAPAELLPFALQHRGKRPVVIDVTSGPGQAALAELLATADVLLRDGDARQVAPGLDAADLAARFPTLVDAHAGSVGAAGPEGVDPLLARIADDAAFFARAGASALMTAGSPFAFGTLQAARSAAFALTAGVLVALHARRTSGRGHAVRTSLLAAGLYSIANDVTVALRTDTQPNLRDRRDPLSPLANAYLCRDRRWLMLGVQSAAADAAWPRLREVLGDPAWMHDARFATREARAAHGPELVTELDAAFAADDRDAWRQRLVAASLNCGWWPPA